MSAFGGTADIPSTRLLLTQDRSGHGRFQVFRWPNIFSMLADIRSALAIVNDRDNAPSAAVCDMTSSNCFRA
jgi:hypothetical protein